MVSGEAILLVTAADRRELAGFRGLQALRGALRWSAWTRLDSRPALLAAHGPGQANAAEAVSIACANHRVAAIVSTGFAGGLDPLLKVGDIFLAREVARVTPEVEYPVSLPAFREPERAAEGRLLTIDRVARSAEEKVKLYSLGGQAVDMEAAATAEQAAGRGLPFFCVRAISDGAETTFPVDFNRCRREDGTFSGLRVAAQAGFHPARWRALLRLGRDARRAAERLAAFLRACRFPLESE